MGSKLKTITNNNMAKRKEAEVDAVVEELVESGITKLDIDLHREDLNAVVAKVNELVDVLNGCKKCK